MKLTKEELIEGNKLIAIFDKLLENNKGRRFDLDKLNVSTSPNYHSSWDWLMPVIDTINGMGKEYNVSIFKTFVSVSVEKSGKMYKDFSFAHSENITSEQTGKEATFKLLVKFIKWHNENIMSKNLVESK